MSTTTTPSSQRIDPRIPQNELSTEAAAPITSFVSQYPNDMYTLDAPKGASSVQLCRGGTGPGKSCVEIHEEVTKVFAMMQKQGFFCQLPFDPSRTEIDKFVGEYVKTANFRIDI